MLDLDGLHRRAAFVRAIRSFFEGEGFLEVDTPIRQPVYIPESNIEPIPSEDHYLQASPELCMKRLLAAGCQRIFQISHCFRKGELGRLHLEEFLMLEWYRTGCDYRQLMTDCEQLLRSVCTALQNFHGASDILAGVDLAGEWQRLSVAEAFRRYCPRSLEWALTHDRFDELLVEHVEPRLGHAAPVFLYQYPARLASLARTCPHDPSVAERFELYIKGIELANGFSELTDVAEQRRRFAEEIAAILAGRGTIAQMPGKFLSDLAKIDQAAGIALGVDRLFMLLSGGRDIASVVSFGPGDFC